MAKDQKYIMVDTYTADLLEQVVSKGKAGNIAEAVGKSVADYLGVRYKSREERKLEQERDRILELGKKAAKEE